jgi:energy-converting hydrogenase A subunit R
MIEAKPKIYFTDGEGPVVFKDLARNISKKRLPVNFFDIVSMWVAHDTEKQTPVFEPGDTLALIVPHLIVHDVTDQDLHEEALRTTVATGIKEHFVNLKNEGWQIRIISSAYKHLWEVCAPAVGIDSQAIASTKVDFEQIKKQHVDSRIRRAILQAEESIEQHREATQLALKEFANGATLDEVFDNPSMQTVDDILSELYFSRLPNYDFPPTDVVRVVGGIRKVDAIKSFASELNVDASQVVYIGDSITDDKANKFVKESEGLSIAVNADKYAIRNARVAVATADMRSIKPLLDAWVSGGFDRVKIFAGEVQFMQGKERDFGSVERPAKVSIVTAQCIESTAVIHRECREKIRGNSCPIL